MFSRFSAVRTAADNNSKITMGSAHRSHSRSHCAAVDDYDRTLSVCVHVYVYFDCTPMEYGFLPYLMRPIRIAVHPTAGRLCQPIYLS